MTTPTPDDRRSTPRRRATDLEPGDVLPAVEEALVRSSALAELVSEVHELGEAVDGYRQALDRYRNTLERRLTIRARLYAFAIAALSVLLVLALFRIDRNARDEVELRDATADAVLVECEKRKRLEVGLIAFLEESLTAASPERRAELLELADELFSSIPCTELADSVRNAHN